MSNSDWDKFLEANPEEKEYIRSQVEEQLRIREIEELLDDDGLPPYPKINCKICKKEVVLLHNSEEPDIIYILKLFRNVCSEECSIMLNFKLAK